MEIKLESNLTIKIVRSNSNSISTLKTKKLIHSQVSMVCVPSVCNTYDINFLFQTLSMFIFN